MHIRVSHCNSDCERNCCLCDPCCLIPYCRGALLVQYKGSHSGSSEVGRQGQVWDGSPLWSPGAEYLGNKTPKNGGLGAELQKPNSFCYRDLCSLLDNCFKNVDDWESYNPDCHGPMRPVRHVLCTPALLQSLKVSLWQNFWGTQPNLAHLQKNRLVKQSQSR